MRIEQFVMAYGVEQDRLRAILPDGFSSLRPVLRLNAEIQNGEFGYVEFHTAVEKDGVRGWLNIGCWHRVPFVRSGRTVTFRTDFLELTFTGVGLEGACPAEKDNGGCYYWDGAVYALRKPETVFVKKEFCDCTFQWRFSEQDAHGKSVGKTLPAIPTEATVVYPKVSFTVNNAVRIPCDQVLGAYTVVFDRDTDINLPHRA